MAPVPDLSRVLSYARYEDANGPEFDRYRMQNERYVHRVGEAIGRDKHANPPDRVRERSGWRRVALGVQFEYISDSSNPVLVAHARTLLPGDVFVLLDATAARTLEGFIQAMGRRPGSADLSAPDVQGIFWRRPGQSFLTPIGAPAAYAVTSRRKTQREIGLGGNLDLNLNGFGC